MNRANRRSAKDRARLERLRALPDFAIDCSDIPAATEQQLARMAPLTEYLATRAKKERLTIRVDKDVVAWLRSEGDGYQTRLNDILRDAMRRSIRRRRS
ncbi:MAG: BrnA antitoxin family protein [Acidobacteriaceae bacterium]|nr:BrnA antitoxin family protein [Acidobacteriaceae bacterium]